MATTTAAHTTATSTVKPPSNSTATTMISDESMKLAIATALLRSNLLPQSQPQRQRHSQPLSSSLSSSGAFRWKQKAKDRKQEVIRLKNELKHLEGDLRGDLFPQSVSCKCCFFNNLQGSNPNQLKHGADHRLSDVLRRQFLRQVRLRKRMKKSTSNSINRGTFTELYKEEETEQLKLSAEFLVDLCEACDPVKTPNFASLTHQSVDFILGSLNRVLSMGRDAAVVEGTISSLIVRLVKRMCTPMKDELYCDPETDAQIHVQHIIRQLGSVAYVGQRVLLSLCHRISESAETLFSLDPFDESFALIHDSLFVMIQLVEFMISDYLVTWCKDEDFDTKLFEEWLSSFLHARDTLQLIERRSGIYALYMDRVTGELARQVGQVSSFQKLNQDIIDSLFS